MMKGYEFEVEYYKLYIRVKLARQKEGQDEGEKGERQCRKFYLYDKGERVDYGCEWGVVLLLGWRVRS